MSEPVKAAVDAAFPQPARLLCGVSGGRDSVVLLHALVQCGHTVEAAHVNYALRGSDSDADEDFVRQLCARLNVPLHVQHPDVKAYAHEHKLHIQEAARNLRYSFFRRLLCERNLHLICVAHHQTDQMETFFINALRGSGVQGLSGMQPLQGDVARPLLQLTTSQIDAYAHQWGLSWREDASNATDAYLRNRIRHHLLPAVERLDHHFPAGLLHTIHQMSRHAQWEHQEAERLYAERITPKAGYLLYRLPFEQSPPEGRLLMQRFGFSPSQVDEVYALEGSQSGAAVSCAATHAVRHPKGLALVANAPQPEFEQQIKLTSSGQIDLPTGRLAWGEAAREQLNHPDWFVVCMENISPNDEIVVKPPQAGDKLGAPWFPFRKTIADVHAEEGIPKPLRAWSLVVTFNETPIWLAGVARCRHSPKAGDGFWMAWLPQYPAWKAPFG